MRATRTPAKTSPARRRSPAVAALTLDEALVALFIGAMNANDHVAPDEAARAHHLIWSTRRFRRRSGETVGRLIQQMKALAEQSDARALAGRAAKTIPPRLRRSAFAVVVDLLLADGRMDRKERRYLEGLAAELKLDEDDARRILDVISLKNQL